MNKHIQTIGFVTKEEQLQILNFKILENTFVLETTNPFPGYHREIVDRGIPKTVYFILKQPIYRENLARLQKKLKTEVNFSFDIHHSKIVMNNQTFNAIRVFNIDDYDHVYTLQKKLSEHQISFMNSKSKDGEAIITSYLQFDLIQLAENLFKSNTNNSFYYFTVKKELSWFEFKSLTLNIKNSWNLNNFDAAQGIVYMNNEIYDIIRIFSANATTDDVVDIVKKYGDKIN